MILEHAGRRPRVAASTTLDFPGTVFRTDRSVPEADRIRRYARALRRQKDDVLRDGRD